MQENCLYLCNCSSEKNVRMWKNVDSKKKQMETPAKCQCLHTCPHNTAERQGFEPWEQLPVHRISSAARSTTPASFRCEISTFF